MSSSHILCDGTSTLWVKNVAQRSENSLHSHLYNEPQMSGSLTHGRVEHYTALYGVGQEGSISEKVH